MSDKPADRTEEAAADAKVDAETAALKSKSTASGHIRDEPPEPPGQGPDLATERAAAYRENDA